MESKSERGVVLFYLVHVQQTMLLVKKHLLNILSFQSRMLNVFFLFFIQVSSTRLFAMFRTSRAITNMSLLTGAFDRAISITKALRWIIT
jgi:hypothetical protein